MTDRRGAPSMPARVRSRWMRRAVVGTWLFVSIGMLGVPLLNQVGYESSLVINILVVLLGGPAVIGRYQNVPLWEQFWRRSAVLACGACVSVSLLLVSLIWAPICDVRAGIGLWVMFGLGGIPPVVALGLLCERATRYRGRTLAITCYFAVVVLSSMASVWWLATQPPLAVYDAFTGFWSVSIYDEAQRAWWSHWPYRLMTWFGAALWCFCLAFEKRPSVANAAWGVTLAVGLVLMSVFAADLNIARSRASIIEMLGGQEETDHFVIYYESSALSSKKLELLLTDVEQQYAELHTLIGGDASSKKARLFVYASSKTKEAAMGSANTMIARVWLGEMHVVWQGYGDPGLRHEMVHVLLRDHGYGPLRLSSANGVVPLMGLVEGAASGIAWNVDGLTDHQWAAAILDNGLMPDLPRMIHASSFWTQSGPLAYTVWSSFCRWLIDTRGMDSFLAAYARGQFASVYDTTIESLMEQWQMMLRTIALAPDELAEARLRFDRPSLLYRMCGRDVARVEKQAREQLIARQWQQAHASIAWLAAHAEDDPSLALRTADLWAWLNEDQRAAAWYDTLAQKDGVGLAIAQRARLARADLAWKRDDIQTATRWMRRIEDHPMTADMRRALWVRAEAIAQKERAPFAYRATQRYLTGRPNEDVWPIRMDIATAALQEHSAAAAWLAYRVALSTQAYDTAQALVTVLREAELPDAVAREFGLNELQRFAEQGWSDHCEQYPYAEQEGLWEGKAIVARLDMLRRRCKVARLRLDTVRDTME